MAKVKDVVMNFPASTSGDVTKYMLYVVAVPAAVDAVDGNADFTAPSFDIGTNLSVKLNDLPGMTTTDGLYNIGVTAIDDAGNESSMSTVSDVPLDFVAPDAPGQITITRT